MEFGNNYNFIIICNVHFKLRKTLHEVILYRIVKAGSESALKKQLNPDPHEEKQLDPDPHKINADPQPCHVQLIAISL